MKNAVFFLVVRKPRSTHNQPEKSAFSDEQAHQAAPKALLLPVQLNGLQGREKCKVCSVCPYVSG